MLSGEDTHDVTWNKEAGEEDHEEHEALNVISVFSSFSVVFRQFRNYLTSRYERSKPLPDSTLLRWKSSQSLSNQPPLCQVHGPFRMEPDGKLALGRETSCFRRCMRLHVVTAIPFPLWVWDFCVRVYVCLCVRQWRRAEVSTLMSLCPLPSPYLCQCQVLYLGNPVAVRSESQVFAANTNLSPIIPA